MITSYTPSCELAAAASEGFVGGMGWDGMRWDDCQDWKSRLTMFKVVRADREGRRAEGQKGRKIVKWKLRNVKLRNVKCEM